MALCLYPVPYIFESQYTSPIYSNLSPKKAKGEDDDVEVKGTRRASNVLDARMRTLELGGNPVRIFSMHHMRYFWH